jgi:type I restriction enzyme S subunit
MATNQGFKSVVFKQMQDADYYFHLFEKVKPELVRRGSGTTFLEVSGAEFGAIFVPSPPRCEKQHIAQILDTLDIAIQQTEAFIAKLNAAQLGLLHDLLTRGIDANGELRTPQIDAPHLYQASPVGWIPIGWTYLTLKEAAESIIDGPFGSNLKTEHYVPDSGVRVVRLQNIQLGGYDDTDRAFISDKHAASLARNRVTAGDALIASLGDDSYPIGRSCLYPADLPDAVNKADCFRFRGKSTCRNAYVALFMNSLAARRQIRGYEQGVTMKRINLGNLKRVCVSLPRAAEQELIIDRAATAAAQIDANVRQLRKLRHQRLGLSDDLLTGRVRVSSLLTKTEQAALEAAS